MRVAPVAIVKVPLLSEPVVSPLNGTLVAAMVPEPVTLSEAPVPTCMLAWVFTPLVIVLNAAEPAVPPLVPQLHACVAVLKFMCCPAVSRQFTSCAKKLMPVAEVSKTWFAPVLAATVVPAIWFALLTPVPEVVSVAPLPSVKVPAGATPVVTPPNDTVVAAIEPEPVAEREAPVPTNIFA